MGCPGFWGEDAVSPAETPTFAEAAGRLSLGLS